MSGGTVSLQATYRVLMDNDRGDVLWDVLQEPSAPSYANFFNQGRTTIPESWDFAGSQNHMILLQIDEWFSKGLTGIRQAPGSVGYERVIIKPQAVGTLSHVSGSYQSPRGEITSEWRKGSSGVASMKCPVPAGVAATVYVPATAEQSFVGATPKGRVPGYQVFEVQPGETEFAPGHEHRGAGRRDRAGDVVALARRSGLVRRVHARCDEGVHDGHDAPT